MKLSEKHLSLVILGGVLAALGALLLRFAQVNASGPDNHQLFLPLVNNSHGSAAAVAPPPVYNAAITAQGGRIDAFTFYIPFAADRLDDQFNIGQTRQNLLDVDIETIISIAVQRSGSVIYYDQWEDGLERDVTRPAQFTTQIWGDGDPTNGAPPNLGGRDVLRAGDVIILRNIVALPRDPAALFFDGGDMFTSVGGPVAVSLTFWTAPPGPGILFTDAWELYPTNRWGNEYRIPIGENLAGSGANQRLGFTIVGLNVQAVDDNTTVEIDLDGDGVFETTTILNQGQQYNVINGVRTGAQIRTLNSKLIQVHLFAAYPPSTYEARGYTIVPLGQWTNNYLAPRSSDGDFWLYNPDRANPLNVQIQTLNGASLLNIPANTTLKFPPAGLSGPTAAHFISTDGRPFSVLAALDASQDQDWGYAVLPFNRLATQTLVGLGLGNNNNPPGPGSGGTGFESRVYVTAVETTTVFVDYNNDGTVDASFPVSPLAEIAVTDPNDYDMTGAFLFTNDGTPFVAVWGQDASAPVALPSIDAGTGVVPLPSLLLQKTFTNTACADTVTVGDTVQFNLQFFNNTVNPIRDVVISDTLPVQVDYLPNTTRLNGSPLPEGGGSTPFALDEGGYNVGAIPRLGAGFITFDAVVTDDSQGQIINQAEARSGDLPLGSDTVFISIAAQPAPPILQVSQPLLDPANGLAARGQVITFSIAITNVSSSTITQLPLQDTFNNAYLTFLRANPSPNLSASGVFTWTDLTTLLGDLAPGATLSATVSFEVNQLPPTVANTLVTAAILKARRNDNAFPLSCSASGRVNFFEPNPAIEVKKYTNGFDADNPDTDPIPQIDPGDPVTWDYVVTNIGNVPLSNVTLVDDQLALQGISPTFIGGDANGDHILDLTETWTYQATGIAEDLPNSNRPVTRCGAGGVAAPTYTNLATATGQYLQTSVTDNDPSHYCSPPPSPPPSPGCQKNCEHHTPVPPAPPPAIPAAPAATPVLPIIFLPETGYQETSQPGEVISRVTAWVVILSGMGVLALYLKGKT